MRLHRFEARQTLPCTLRQAWDFFAAPANLARVTPPAFRLHFTAQVPERMYAGMLLGYRLSPIAGVPLTWVNEITHVDEPHHFIDEQRFGPYRFFRHEHHYRAVEGGTEMWDLVHYALPRGTGAVRRLLVAPQLDALFAYRRQALEAIFGPWNG